MRKKSQQKTANNQQLKAKSSKFKSVLIFFKKNYFLFIIVGCVGFVGIVAFYKLYISKPTYIYAKIKVGQGMWWASTQKLNLWYVKAIMKAKDQKDLTGKPIATMLDVIYYPFYVNGVNGQYSGQYNGQYDVYVTLKLKVTRVGNMGSYNFNREALGVSSPIDLEFPTVQYSGTILEISEKPFKDVYEDKIIYFYKKNVRPWEYEQIQIGDTFKNGKEKVFEILSKEKGESNDVLLSDFEKLVNWDTELYNYVKIRARMRVKKTENNFLYGEETVITSGRTVGIATENYMFDNFVIMKVE